MIREISIELAFPDFLTARYGAEQQRVPLPLGVEQNFLFQLLDRLDETDARSRERFMVYLGQQLHDALFPSGAQEVYLRAQADQRRIPAAALRIRVQSRDPRLLTLPWEFLYDSRQGLFPASVPESPIVRTQEEIQPGSALSPVSPLRLLLVGASPSDQPPLAYQAELNLIAEKADRAGLELKSLASATGRQLARVLGEFKPHLVHFMGHGFVDDRGAGLKLEDRTGGTHLVYGEQLATWLEPAAPQLVVLNACDSALLCQSEERAVLPLLLMARGVPAVVAMQHRIPDVAGRIFGEAFFDALLQAIPLELAVQRGRHALLVSEGLAQCHFTTPVLYLARAHGGTCVRSPESEVVSPLSPSGVRPFVFLNSFSREQHSLFFGRAKAVESLVSLVATHRLLVVHGRSGVGKTSLLQAGLAQSTAAHLYFPVTLRFLQDPVRALEEVLERALNQLEQEGYTAPLVSRSVAVSANARPALLPEQPSAAAVLENLPQGAKRMLRLQALSGRTLLLILDQFEEFFILLDEAARERFLDTLHSVYADPGLRLRIVLVIREDFFGELDRLRDLFPTILANSYYLSPFTQDEARDALVGPLESLGIPYQRSLIDAILSDLYLEGVEPSSLQIVGHHLFEDCYSRQRQPLTLDAYERLGRASGILAAYMMTFYNRFSSHEKAVLQTVLNHFITQQGTRQPTTLAEICSDGKVPHEDARVALDRLLNAHLVRRLEAGGEPDDPGGEEFARWELAHEVLIEAIHEAGLSTYREQLERLRRLNRLQTVGAAAVLSLMVLLGGVMRGYGLMLEVDAPGAGHWTLRLLPEGSACGADVPRLLHTFAGNRARILLPSVGTYEARLKRDDGVETRFPVEVTPFGFASFRSRLPPDLPGLPEGMELVYVGGGSAHVGHEELYRLKASVEPRKVELEPYFISRYEVTQAQYAAYVDAQRRKDLAFRTEGERAGCFESAPPSSQAGSGDGYRHVPVDWGPESPLRSDAASNDRLPAVMVTHRDATEYAEWLTEQNPGYVFRLPTDEEWEVAARGLDQRMYPWGTCWDSSRFANLAWTGTDSDPYKTLAPIGSFPLGQSPYGVHDMSGNILEHVKSCSRAVRKNEYEPTLPDADGKCGYHSFRGGSYLSSRMEGFATRQEFVSSDACLMHVGFRVILESPEHVSGETDHGR